MIQLRVRFRELGLRRYHRALRMFKDLKPEMEKVGAFALKEAADRLAARRSQTSIGRLAKSLKYKAFNRSVGFVSSLAYAIIQQAGGVIKPKKRQWLAIAVRLADKRAHVWPKHVSGKPGVRLVFIPQSAGKAYLLFTRVKKVGDRMVRTESYVRWVLRKEVTVRARPYFVKSRELLLFMRRTISEKLHRDNRRGA